MSSILPGEGFMAHLGDLTRAVNRNEPRVVSSFNLRPLGGISNRVTASFGNEN